MKVSLNQVLQELNKTGELVKEQLKLHGFEFKPEDWTLEILYPTEWRYRCINREIKPFAFDKQDKLLVHFHSLGQTLYVTIFFSNMSYYEILKWNVSNAREFSERLAQTFLENDLTISQAAYKSVRTRYAKVTPAYSGD